MTHRHREGASKHGCEEGGASEEGCAGAQGGSRQEGHPDGCAGAQGNFSQEEHQGCAGAQGNSSQEEHQGCASAQGDSSQEEHQGCASQVRGHKETSRFRRSTSIPGPEHLQGLSERRAAASTDEVSPGIHRPAAAAARSGG
jgi:hypothetical protein